MRSAVWGGLDCPITQPWGPTTLAVEPLYRLTHWHCGVDVAMPTGTRLYAARAGKVTQLSYGLLGIYVAGTIDVDFYVHIDRPAIGYGASVKAGDLIAWSGNKVPGGGYSTGPHLHFEINWAGLNVPPGLDPAGVLAGAYSAGSGGSELSVEFEAAALPLLQRMFNVLMVGYHTATPADDGFLKKVIRPEIDQVANRMAALEADVRAITVHEPTVDFSSVNQQLTQLRAQIGELTAAIEALKSAGTGTTITGTLTGTIS